MSDGNIAFVQRLYAAFGRGDIATIVAAMAPDVTWELTGRPKDHSALGRRKGPNGVGEFFGIIADTQDSVSFAPREFHPSSDLVFVLGNYVWKMRITGKSVDSD